MRRTPLLKGWRYAAFVGSVVGFIGVAIYPIIISPFFHQDEWRKINEENRKRANIKQEEIQPGNMKIWTDPFDRPVKEK